MSLPFQDPQISAYKDFEIAKLMRLHQAVMMRLWEGRRFSLLKISAQQAKVPGIKPREQECFLCLQGQACERVCVSESLGFTVCLKQSHPRNGTAFCRAGWLWDAGFPREGATHQHKNPLFPDQPPNSLGALNLLSWRQPWFLSVLLDLRIIYHYWFFMPKVTLAVCVFMHIRGELKWTSLI